MPVKMNILEFIEKANKKHFENYDYSESIYVNSKTKIKIKHKECGMYFYSIPNNHLIGSGCSHCYQKVSHSREFFIEKSRKVHGNKYNYDKVVYVSNKVKVNITCNKCGLNFNQKPFSHTRGDGCIRCCGKEQMTNDSFKVKAKLIHGEKYNYSLVDYQTSKDKVTIICNTCNSKFSQYASNHLAGNGCPSCKTQNSGWTKSKFKGACEKNGGNGLLYLLKINDKGEFFYKIGITSRKLKERFKKSAIPYSYEVIATHEDSADFIWDMERKLKILMRKNEYIPKISFGGSRFECFSCIDDYVNEFFGIVSFDKPL